MFSEQVSFAAFCNLCEHLARLRKVESKRAQLAAFVEEWRRMDADHLYDLFRLLLPHLDSEHESYGIKEAKLADLYIAALAIAPTSHDASRLRNWEQSPHADFAQVLEGILASRLGEDPASKTRKPGGQQLSIAAVSSFLHALCTAGSADVRRELFLPQVTRLTAQEQKWVARIILKCLRLGLPDVQILKLLHDDAPAFYDVRMDLREVVELLKNEAPHSTLPPPGISPFRPFRPMLADRGHPNMFKNRDTEFYIEPKFDGERLQIHFQRAVDQPQFRYWSRHGKDYTFLYGKDAFSGSLSPKLLEHGAIRESVQTAVFDGEMVAFDASSGKVLPFGTLKSAAKQGRNQPDANVLIREASQTQAHPCFIAFDLVYLNGQSLLTRPFRDRRLLLAQSIKHLDGRFELIQSKLGSTADDIQTAMDAAIETQGEGLIVKSPNSIYQPGKRAADWIKIKAEYVEGLCDDLDLVIMGAWYGRSGSIQVAHGRPNSFLCGAWNDSHTRVLPFCKLGGGFNLEEWLQLAERLEGNNLKPYTAGPAGCDTGEVVIPPGTPAAYRPDAIVSNIRQSVVIQVKGSQLVPSDSYADSPITLRHPRFVRLRPDRPPESSMTMADLHRLNDVTSGTLAKRRLADLSCSPKAASPKRVRPKGKLALAIEEAQSKKALLCATQAETSYLEGYCLLIVNGTEKQDKLELEQSSVGAGAEILQSPPQAATDRRFLVVAGKDAGLRLRNLKAAGKHNIVRADWLLDSLSSKQALDPYQSQYAIQLSEPPHHSTDAF